MQQNKGLHKTTLGQYLPPLDLCRSKDPPSHPMGGHVYIGLKNDKRATYFLSYSLASSFLMNNQNGEINEPKVYIAAVGYK
jgi:hypothetical protein